MTQYNLRSREISSELGVHYSPRQSFTNRSPLEALRKSVHLKTFKQPSSPENLKESANDQIEEMTNSFDNSQKQLAD